MQKLKQIPKRVHHFLIGLVLTAVLGVLAFAVVNTYTAYTDMVVQQQQQYLLVTAAPSPKRSPSISPGSCGTLKF